ncbi:BofC C-terminal domain-containing protein [uncultured Tyzzerella sp.]|uniref:BofC C-terminal domain-containing protein n=1 Tax=uncultured Tyzzerella sp. TaxID=2321398 RepID=UPI0029425C65|nr:BofC C-terminal domain-containing protein [uncultured Tyzzerella sp.]
MVKKIYFVLFFILVIFVSIISASIGYNMYSIKNNENQIIEYKNEANVDFFKEKPVDNITVAKITPSTKMTYEYFYKNDNITEKVEDVPPYFLIDLTRNDLEENFKDWQIKEFSSSEVVLQKVIDGESTQHYIIGEYEGYIAVYYEQEINGTKLKEITDIPLDGLPKEEQDKIKNGIKIKGKDDLIKFLESYGS